MRGETVRRLLVFGVCALGVTGLYLIPSVARSPEQLAGSPVRDDAPTAGPTLSTKPVSASLPASATATPNRTLAVDPPDDDPGERVTTRSTESAASDPKPEATPRPTKAGGTPFLPGQQRDETPPAAVSQVRLEKATPDTATISWPQTTDDVGVTAYLVWLNGYVVKTTTETTATVPWFNDDSTQQIVQVRAVDAAGNQSRTAASLLARRPTPSPTSTPTSTPTNPAPATPSATPTPDGEASTEADQLRPTTQSTTESTTETASPR